MSPQGTVLPLQKGIIYGPVASRRLGRSLGINLLPTAYKACSYNCIYCHYGWTRVKTNRMEVLAKDLPSVAQVEAALAASLADGVDPEYITFSGNGEPTLHPDFAEMVEVVVRLRDRFAPQAKTCVLSNATGLDRPAVVDALQMLDLRVLKLDAGTEQSWRVVNRPASGLHFEQLLAGLQAVRDWVLQAVFFQGRISNAGPEEVERWIDRLAQLQPTAAQIYTVDRPAADGTLAKVPVSVLQDIASRASRETGVPVQVYSGSTQAEASKVASPATASERCWPKEEKA
ncbi:MAG: radical SAM protein [Calditrichaeota bacterium]|nr:radical SAM protein [Calditrichota bacterium]